MPYKKPNTELRNGVDPNSFASADRKTDISGFGNQDHEARKGSSAQRLVDKNISSVAKKKRGSVAKQAILFDKEAADRFEKEGSLIDIDGTSL